jgi:hypothetical protein
MNMIVHGDGSAGIILHQGLTDIPGKIEEEDCDLCITTEELGVLSEEEALFLPITTNGYIYLSGTTFTALATGEFIEGQIFKWTYTDEQGAKADRCTEDRPRIQGR